MDRHIFPEHSSLVLRSLKGLVGSHPSLTLLPQTKTVINAAHDRSKVALICGGGAGHEPGSTGFVGSGFLSASVSGDIFASPSAKQVYTAIKAVPSDEGTILIITNYTGDNLHFGLACQQARANGIDNVAILPVCDDVSVGRTKGALVGRRAMAGTILVCKILGAAAEGGLTFRETLELGRAVTGGLLSIGCTLGHCHVPGRDNAKYGVIGEDTIEIGLGLHNEPGVYVVSPQPAPDRLVDKMLDLLLNQEDKERAFVPFQEGDAVVLFVNNMGGMSTLEMYAVVEEVTRQLESHPLKIRIARTHCGSFMTSLNAPGFSITLLNLSFVARARNNGKGEAEIIELIDAPHASAAWPGSNLSLVPDHLAKRTREERFVDVVEEPVVKMEESSTKVRGMLAILLLFDPQVLRRVIRAGAQAVLASEPDLTKWDTIVGDGDCGETCAAGSKAILKALDDGLGEDGDLVGVLRDVTETIDDTCGGTLGAIYSIFLAALTAEVRILGAEGHEVNMAMWGEAAGRAIETLGHSTKARVGHRTVMDALIPFAEGLSSSTAGESETDILREAIRRCVAGGEGTRDLVAKLGRATYVGEKESEGGLPPDPGAMSMVAFCRGIGAELL
ncbi:dihydroxyacetone kinase [Guyanagaster necrorhizus]|uniref:Dihydroxyacetone kinase n=1 Tax=Guyanagaster necrorhizus TaxID=856835 RepID=A0A9P8ANU1_9AGAR|nr:dihydroxyacetone kinase [Guyanagaster necrorhizus MCA 3950]KAG7442219.1 dihydroxyacetone kinase [Guyanagaster necrorhizus MCA 3950]